MNVHLSIVIATYNRAAALSRLLTSLRTIPDAHACEVIVADNGSIDETSGVLRADWHPLSVIPMTLASPGKAAALNRAIRIVQGSIVAFTDDDVTVAPGWVSSYLQAYKEYDKARIFCGPIEPSFSRELPSWVTNHPYAPIMFAKFQPDIPKGPLPLRLSPLGPNFAINARLLENVQFRTDLGPSEENGSMMCEDTELLQRLRSMLVVYDDNARTIFVPAARVYHHIVDSKSTGSAIADRFFDLGRSHVIRFCRLTHLSRPSLLPSLLGDKGLMSAEDLITALCQFNFYAGQRFQFTLANRKLEASFISQFMREMCISKYRRLLGPKAFQTLQQDAMESQPRSTLSQHESDFIRSTLEPVQMLPDLFLRSKPIKLPPVHTIPLASPEVSKD